MKERAAVSIEDLQAGDLKPGVVITGLNEPAEINRFVGLSGKLKFAPNLGSEFQLCYNGLRNAPYFQDLLRRRILTPDLLPSRLFTSALKRPGISEEEILANLGKVFIMVEEPESSQTKGMDHSSIDPDKILSFLVLAHLYRPSNNTSKEVFGNVRAEYTLYTNPENPRTLWMGFRMRDQEQLKILMDQLAYHLRHIKHNRRQK